MAIAKVIPAKDGDSLCGLAVANGFKNCTKLRAANSQLAGRGVRPGDKINIPELTPKQLAGQVDTLHRFRRPGKVNRVFIIQDRNRADGPQATADRQKQLAVSNYVPGRQGTAFAAVNWVTDAGGVTSDLGSVRYRRVYTSLYELYQA